jgi:hypothetical protein
MTVTIENSLAPGPVAIPLTTGQWLRLAAREKSPELPDIYATVNAKVDKLRRQRVTEVVTHCPTSDSDAVAGEAAEVAAPAPAQAPCYRSTE